MEDKDRLGDKLRDKGKGDEEQYFCQQEQKRLDKLRESAAPCGRCPKDGTVLVASTSHGVTTDACPTCRGIWLPIDQLEEMLARESEAGVTRWVRSLLSLLGA